MSLSCQQVNRLCRNEKVCTPYEKQYRRPGFYILFRFRKKPAENKKSLLNVFIDGDALMQPKERRPPCQTLSRGQMNHNFRKHQEFSRPIQVLSVLLQPARIAGKKVCCQTCAFHRIFYHQSLKIHSTESVCKISVSYTGGFVQSFLHFALEELLFPMVFFPKKWTVHPKCFSRAHLFFLWIFIAKTKAPSQWKYPLSKPVCFLYLL